MIMKEITLSLIKRSLVWQFTLVMIFFTNILAANDEGKVEITGELKMWHKVTLTFDGPRTSETANPNPFTSYRLDVTFTKGGESYLVPGYFAADGNAANTGSSGGNKWRVHFSPPASGTWEYLVSFRKGTNIHAEASPDAGESAAFMDGDKGFKTALHRYHLIG